MIKIADEDLLTRMSVPDAQQSISEAKSYETGASTNSRADDFICIWPQYIWQRFHIYFKKKTFSLTVLYRTEHRCYQQAIEK